jgi:hypothetical protein
MVAAAIQQAPKRHQEQNGSGRYRATVTRWDSPGAFTVDLHGHDLDLTDDDVTLGQTVRRYEADVGIKEGDNLVLLELADGDFVAVEVESDTEATGP